MATLAAGTQNPRMWLSGALTVTRRELRDILRDWRIVIPIILLTLIFPLIMNFTAGVAQDFVQQYGAEIIGDRIIPFLLMIVGFFPSSFSLVVALETFVGERERKSIEALLCTPLSDGQLYAGKTMAAMLPPLAAAYLGTGVYLLGLYVLRGWTAPPQLLFQIILLTTFEGIVMVSGAVIISSQTTSTRAANLLASFIIIPMALLVQAESIIMFWGRYDILWGFIAGLIVVDLILIRMGVQLFDREELLGREFDKIDLGKSRRTFVRFLKQAEPFGAEQRFTLWRVYRTDLPAILRRARNATLTVLVATALGIIAGLLLARIPLPALSLDIGDGVLTTSFVVGNNLRVVLVTMLLAIFSFGVLPTVVPLVNSALIVWLLARAAEAGHDPLTVFVAGILPHGIFEISAVWLASILALRMGASLIARQPGMTLGEGWLLALADYLKMFIFVVLPLLILAALIEVNITPRLLMAALGQ